MAPSTDAMQPLPPPDARKQELAEQVRIQYRNMPTAYIGSVVMTTLLLVIMRRSVDVTLAAAWLMAMHLQAAMRHLQWRDSWRAESQSADAPRRGRHAAPAPPGRCGAAARSCSFRTE